jgi:hypothetical protein
MRTLFKTFSKSPNLKELELSIYKPRIEINGQPYAFDFRSNADIKLPTLEVLKLDGYNLDSRSNIDWEGVPEDPIEDEDEDDFDVSYSPKSGTQQVWQNSPYYSHLLVTQ